MISHKKSNSTLRLRNKRIIYLVAVGITILLGLSSRKFSYLLPLFVAHNVGDMLWAMMVYFGFRFLLVRKNLYSGILLSILFSFGIEFSQLYQADWINQIRDTVLGELVLGKVFFPMDLLRYSIGIVIAALLDKLALVSR